MIEKQNGIKEETLEMPSNNELNRIYFTILCVDPDVPHGFGKFLFLPSVFFILNYSLEIQL